MKTKIISILIILIVFCSFTTFEICRKSLKKVLNIESASVLNIDMNNNGIYDTGETICIEGTASFTANLSKNQTDLQDLLKLSHAEALQLGYLTDEFAENLLSGKKVKVKILKSQYNQKCKSGDIFINGNSYKSKLLNSGFGIANGQSTENFQKQLDKARKLKLVILNHKSNKFHNLNCEYGLAAHDTIIIPQKHLTKDSKPCKFCHISQEKTKANVPEKTYPLIISNGCIKMYLTDLTSKLKPDNKCTSPVCKEVLNRINSSKTSIDIALYGWDNIKEIYNALLDAKSRGVKIRLVYDTSKNNYYPQTQSLVSIADNSSTDTMKFLMHNKFMIFDKKSIVTGSMNFTKTGFSGFNTNCIFFINSTEIAKIYLDEFEQMLNGKFHQEKSVVSHKTVSFGNTKITPLFSPKDKAIVNNIIPIINSAQKYIYIPAFILTHDDLANSLIKAKTRGVDVKIISDATSPSSSRSKVKTLRQANIPVKVENYAGKVHSKSIIIDDKYIISGSMNFTNSGENKNDENCLIIEDQRLAVYYKGFFNYLWKKIPDKYLKYNPRPEGKSSIGSCTDGIDNNYDGKIDMNDAACN